MAGLLDVIAEGCEIREVFVADSACARGCSRHEGQMMV